MSSTVLSLGLLLAAIPGTPQPPQQTATKAPQAGEVKVNPKDGLKYVRIPPGTFLMGCSPGDNKCYGNEKPPHQVTISKGFWMGQTVVTAGAYQRFASATGRQMHPAPSFDSGWANQNMPIVYVSWNDSQAYCQWAGGGLQFADDDKAALFIARDGQRLLRVTYVFPDGSSFEGDRRGPDESHLLFRGREAGSKEAGRRKSETGSSKFETRNGRSREGRRARIRLGCAPGATGLETAI